MFEEMIEVECLILMNNIIVGLLGCMIDSYGIEDFCVMLVNYKDIDVN